MKPLAFFKSLLSRDSVIRDGIEVAKELVVDTDKANELIAAFYLAELQTQTIPIVDALHKMGRQILAVLQVLFYFWAVKSGVEVTPELVAGVSGATGIYTIAKGRGK